MKIYWPAVLFILMLGVTACEKKPVTNQATADVFIKSLVSQGDTLYGIAHSAFSFNKISEVTVRTPQGDSLLLPDNEEGGISVFKNPSLELGDYRQSLPVPGIYSYRITFKDNAQSSITNTLGANFLVPAVIDSLGKSQDGQFLVVKWNQVSDAQSYQIRVVKGETEVIAAKRYTADQLRVAFPLASFASFLPGTFTLELDALLFESAGSRQLQALSATFASIDLQ